MGLLLGHPNGRTRLGGVSGLLLVRSFSASDRCNGIPTAEVCCHNTHGKKPDYHSHADIFPFSCGQDTYSQGESLVVDVAGSVDRIERLADGHCHHNWLYAGVGGDSPGAIAVLFQSGFLFPLKDHLSGHTTCRERHFDGTTIDCIEGIACFQRSIRVDFLDMSPYVWSNALGMEGTYAA
ncbi:hypothetical protein [Bifidobacterium sp. ESL0825]|uniref:hypothetical protein n=1 Tax=Bifidobacterium sp. ESL0825 TaxID=3448587 RepID=UPI004041D238